MNQVPLVQVLQVFFLDFVGLVVPGAGLLIGSQTLFLWIPESSGVQLVPPNGFGWAILIVGGYVLGHAVNELGTRFFRVLKIEDRLWPNIREKEGFRAIVKDWEMGELPEETDKARRYSHSVRNVALTIIPERHLQTVYKFTFISLLNKGAATVLLTLMVLAAALRLLKIYIPAVTVQAPVWFWFACPLFAVLFALQQSDFYRRSLGVCFDMAFAVLRDQSEPRKAHRKQEGDHADRPSRRSS